jgi:hypothetical protein
MKTVPLGSQNTVKFTASFLFSQHSTMRGYKVPENAVRVSRLLAWCDNFLTTEDGALLPGFLQ